MSILLFVIVGLVLLYSVYRQDVGIFACFSILYFNVAVTLFQNISPSLFALNAFFHVAVFLILLVWQFNYYSWKTVLHYLTNPVILSLLAMSIIMYLYNGYSPYYHTYKNLIDTSQLNFYSRILFPILILPMMVPDGYTRKGIMNSIPLWGVLYMFIFLSSFNVSSNVLSDRMLFAEATDGITGPITLSRVFAVAVIATFTKLITYNISDAKNIFLYSCLSLLFLFLMIIAGQRGTLIGLAIAITALMIRDEWRHHWLTITILVIIVFVISITFVDYSNFGIFQRFSEFQNIESFKRYHDYFKTWEIFQNNDFVGGLGSMGYHFKTGRPYPHNIILEHISDYGLAGLVCIFILLFYCIKYVINIIKYSGNGTDISIACCWIMLCFSAMVSSSMLNHQLFYTLSGLLVLAYMDFKQSEQENLEAPEKDT